MKKVNEFMPRNIGTGKFLLQAFSSDSSLQSGLPLQNSSLSTHSPLPQDSFPSGHTGSSVFKIGRTFLGSFELELKEKLELMEFRVIRLRKRFMCFGLVVFSGGYCMCQ